MEQNNINHQFIIQSPIQENAETDSTEVINETKKNTVGYWEFFGLIILFAIPLIGFISCIVFMFSPKRESLKNYARALFTWMVIRLVASFLTVLLLINLLGNIALNAINSQFNTQFGSAFEVIELAGDIMSGNYAAVIEAFRPQLIETLGEEYAPLFNELSKEKYNEMFKKISKEDYKDLLTDFENGEYSDLSDAIGEQEFENIKDELKKAANGEHSELFNSIKNSLFSFR